MRKDLFYRMIGPHMIFPVTIYNAECDNCKREFTDLLGYEPSIFENEQKFKNLLILSGWHFDGNKTICDNCHKFDARGNLVINPYKPYTPKAKNKRKLSNDETGDVN